MAINRDETKMISEFYDSDSKSKPILFTGFNRDLVPFQMKLEISQAKELIHYLLLIE